MQQHPRATWDRIEEVEKQEPELPGGSAAIGGGRRLQQEVEEDAVEELDVLLLGQVSRVRDHLHRRFLSELPAYIIYTHE
jgi:hypothetical protein